MKSYFRRLDIDSGMDWAKENLLYEAYTGSISYGTNDEFSDEDIVGYTMVPMEYVDPYNWGWITGFHKNTPKFESTQYHHINGENPDNGKKGIVCDKIEGECDLTIYNIVKFFRLVANNNPNMVDSLFIDKELWTHTSSIHEMVYHNRHMFLSKEVYTTFNGYALSQMKKIKSKQPQNAKRQELIEKYGFDTKFSGHLVRLMLECEQILEEFDLDLRKNSQYLKDVKHGLFKSVEDLEKWFNDKKKVLDILYETSKIPKKPNETSLGILLNQCIEEFHGRR